MKRNEAGTLLMEMVAAIAIIGFAGLTTVELISSGLAATALARAREQELADEERLISAGSLLLKAELDQRLGRREIGPYFLEVQRPERGLYRLAVGRLKAARTEDLVTIVLRPERDSAR
jgi:hypothetical protein